MEKEKNAKLDKTQSTTCAIKPPKMGRPKIEIDQLQFEKLCSIQCTLVEIADWFECSEDTIERFCKETYNKTFAESFKKHSSGGKTSLRRAQFALAKKNATMAIWLGKQYLGQKDVQVLDATLKEETPRIDLSQLTRAEILDLTKKLFDNDGK